MSRITWVNAMNIYIDGLLSGEPNRVKIAKGELIDLAEKLDKQYENENADKLQT